MISQTCPDNFTPRFEIVSCFVIYNEKILLLHRQDHKAEGDTWGVPAGKVDAGEDYKAALSREVFEETGLSMPFEQYGYFGKVYVTYQDYEFIYHIFHVKLEEDPKVKINDLEHKDFQWVSPSSALGENLIQDLDACIKLFFDL